MRSFDLALPCVEKDVAKFGPRLNVVSVSASCHPQPSLLPTRRRHVAHNPSAAQRHGDRRQREWLHRHTQRSGCADGDATYRHSGSISRRWLVTVAESAGHPLRHACLRLLW